MKLYQMYAEYIQNPVSANRKQNVQLQTIAPNKADARLQFTEFLKAECGDRLTWQGDVHEVLEHPKVRVSYFR